MLRRHVRPVVLAAAALAGTGTALALASGPAPRGDFPPCRVNENATTITGTYTGTPTVDTIEGSSDKNLIYGRGGDDVICAYQDRDTVYGGRGEDRIWGEGANDKLYGQRGKDRLRGGSEDDVCSGGPPAGNPDPDVATGCEQTSGASR